MLSIHTGVTHDRRIGRLLSFAPRFSPQLSDLSLGIGNDCAYILCEWKALFVASDLGELLNFIQFYD